MSHPTFALSTPNIATRPAQASRLSFSSKSMPDFPFRPLCVPDMPPVLLCAPYKPNEFQTNSVTLARSGSTPVGLGISGIDAATLSLPHSEKARFQVRSPRLTNSPTALSNTRSLHPRIQRKGSLFDYENSMASMKIEETPTDIEPSANLLAYTIDGRIAEAFTSEFNSLYDLDVQYPSSRGLSAPSPNSALHFTYSPPKLSPSWSLESMFSTSFSTPEDGTSQTSSVHRLWPVSWSSSSISDSPIVVKTEPQSKLPLLTTRTPDMTVPLADINLFQSSVLSAGSCASIDPVYITAPLTSIPRRSNLPQVDLTLKTGPSRKPALPSIDDVFKATEYDHYDSNGFIKALMVASPAKPYNGDSGLFSDYFPTPVVSTRMTLRTSPSVFKAATRPRIIKRKSSNQDIFQSEQGDVKKEEGRAVIPGTPVLDVHRGITQIELEAKAWRYQDRNPGAGEYDKQWLSSFSGKLSVKGEMVKDFRCYVVGCSQVNKRRDHMIIHVGSHLNQRPFQCAHCPSRFLRKNECKRHELSHVDFKPFVCPQCPVGSGGFGRQDLLTRHMRNTHHMEPEKPKKKDKENSRPRKKAKKSQ